jgi:nitroreductase
LSPLAITYDQLLRLAKRRRSCRWYLPQPVPREIIDRAIAVASESPSACNRQPFEFRIFDDPEDARRIGSIPLGTKGFAPKFTCVAVVVGKLHAFPFERDRHVPYIDAALAAMAFQFALEVQGIGSCCINFPDVKQPEEGMAEALQLRPDERPVMLISFGYPDPSGSVPYSQKKSLDELRRYG